MVRSGGRAGDGVGWMGGVGVEWVGQEVGDEGWDGGSGRARVS